MIPTFKDSFKFICIFTKFKIVFCKECFNSEETLGYCCPSHKKILMKYDFTKFCFSVHVYVLYVLQSKQKILF